MRIFASLLKSKELAKHRLEPCIMYLVIVLHLSQWEKEL